MSDEDQLPDSVQSPAPFGTQTKFLGKSVIEIAFTIMILFPGILLFVRFDSYILPIPFLMLAAFSWVYRKDGLPLWNYVVRFLLYFIVARTSGHKRKGKQNCKHLFRIDDFHGSFFRMPNDVFVSMIYVEGLPYDHLSTDHKRNALYSFREFLNNPNFDFDLQILGVPTHAPIRKIAHGPKDNNIKKLNDDQKRLSMAIKSRLDEINEDVRIYNYYMVFKYRCNLKRPDKYKLKKAEREMARRTELISNYLRGMGVYHKVLEGRELVYTLKGFSEHIQGGLYG